MNSRILFTALFTLMFLSIAPSFSHALSSQDNETPITAMYPIHRQELHTVIDNLATHPPLETVLKNRQEIRSFLTALKNRQPTIQKELEQLETFIAGIGDEGTVGNTPNSPLNQILQLKQTKQAELIELRLLQRSYEDALTQIDNYISSEHKKRFLFKEPAIWDSFQQSKSSPGKLWMVQFSTAVFLPLPLLLIITLALLLSLCSFFPGAARFPIGEKIKTLAGAAIYLNNRVKIFQFLFPLLFAATILSFTFDEWILHHPLLSHILCSASLYVLIVLSIQATILRFRRTPKTAEACFDSSPGCLIALHLFSLTTALCIINNISPQLQVAAFAELLILALWLFSLFLLCRYHLFNRKDSSNLITRRLLGLLLLLALFLHAAGYRNLIEYGIFMIASSWGAVIIPLLFYDLIDPLLALIHRSTQGLLAHIWPARPPHTMTRINSQKIISLGLKAYLLAATILAFMQIWGVTNIDPQRLHDLFLEGLSFSGIPISPARITLAFILFLIVWPTIPLFKDLLEQKLITSPEFTPVSRDAFLTITGYIAYGVLLLIILAVAGVRISGLTFIIGALSVGIGFGLQNIVNNFISGLILIFERPIKRGDWVQVGATEGYVKKISIRSTIIQTFDRADVIVPNSELIANQVTNMMLDDHQGRVRVSVGVAYGSDTLLVQRLLLEVANTHPQVITDGTVPSPRALFQAFGESSLDFELLCHIKDIDMKLNVRSDLHMAIDKAFRQHNVEIPFPQRDVHLHKLRNSKETGDNGETQLPLRSDPP